MKQGFINRASAGQATVEGAFLIPIILLLLMLLIQPGILLYNRCVMNSAASEACRMLVTSSISVSDISVYEEAVRRHLGAIPEQDNFHVHTSGCSWEIELVGNEKTAQVSVTIKNEVRPLPLFDFGAKALGMVNEKGNFVQSVQIVQASQPGWVESNPLGFDPSAWVRQRQAS